MLCLVFGTFTQFAPDCSRRIRNSLLCDAVDSATLSELVNRRETSFPASVVRALLCGSQI